MRVASGKHTRYGGKAKNRNSESQSVEVVPYSISPGKGENKAGEALGGRE